MNEKEQKAEIRKRMLAIRDAMPAGEKAMLDERLCHKILQAILERDAKVIHSYLPFGSEIEVNPLLQILLDKKYIVVCPKSLSKRNLQNLVLNSLEDLEEGKFGTKHPADSFEYLGDIDLFIVPCIAFDKEGHRLGYGSGYYDKFFAAHTNGYKIGIGYEYQLIEKFPAEAFDVRLDAVLY